MAKLIKTDGSVVDVSPRDNHFSLEEMYSLLGCGSIQVIFLPDGRIMWIDERGKLKPHQINHLATDLLTWAGGLPGDYIAGSALVTETREIE